MLPPARKLAAVRRITLQLAPYLGHKWRASWNIYANTSVSISELKNNPSAIIQGAEGFAVAILNTTAPPRIWRQQNALNNPETKYHDLKFE